MQIFANPECTEYADGSTMPVYARVNVPWAGLDSGWNIPNEIECYSPDSSSGEDTYGIAWYTDSRSEIYNEPFDAGQIVVINSADWLPIDNPTVIFTKPS